MKYPVMLRPRVVAWMLAASSLPIQPALSAPQVPPQSSIFADQRIDHPTPPFAWYDTTHGRENTTRVWVAGQAVLVFDEDQGPVASAVASRLTEYWQLDGLSAAGLRAIKRGNRYAVVAGTRDILVFGERFARCQGSSPVQLAEHYATQLRAAMAGPSVAALIHHRAVLATMPADHLTVSAGPSAVRSSTGSGTRATVVEPIAALPERPPAPLPPELPRASEPAAVQVPTVVEVSLVDPATIPASASLTALPAVAVTEQVLQALAAPETTPVLSVVATASGAIPGTSPASMAAGEVRELRSRPETTLLSRASGVQRGGYRDDRASLVTVSRGGYDRRGILVGLASWYGGFFHGRRAADGSRFNMHAFTAAHKTLPFGTILDVHNPRTGKHILVRITDRGPYIRGRMLDLSRAAARALGMLGAGVDRVEAVVFRPRKRR